VALTISRRIGSILDTLWYAGSATETLMVLLALLAVTMGVAAVFPQQPPGLQGATAERWLASTTGSYPGAGQFLRQIGAFTIFGSPWLRVLLAALAFNVALRLAIQASTLMKLARRRRAMAEGAPPTLPAESRAINGEGGQDKAETADSKTETTVPAVIGSRSPAPLAGLLAYAGTLVLLAGLFLNSIAGWRAMEIALAPGGSTALGRPDAPRLSLEELTGSEEDPTARIGLFSPESAESRALGGSKPTSAGRIARGQPIRSGNLWIALRSAGPALQATAQDSRGRPLLLQSLKPDNAGGLSQGEVGEEVHLLFHQTQAEQEFALPSANLSFRAVSYPSLPERGIDVPVFLVEVYEGDAPAPVLSDFVVDNGTLVQNGFTLELQRDRYVIVEAAYLPGLVALLLGGLAILAGVTVVSLWSHPRPETEDEGESPGSELSTEPARAS
jgi:hypothetical protein